ncbi:hypothetical protein C8J41_102282 [Sphingomonas sp. PP-CC-3G-468]|nr:hypothetical protein C8J41_102282 [Sphingomonas sp. PP-CC-3G-468]
MRYFEILEAVSVADRAKRDAEKRRVANAKRDMERRKQSDAAREYQDALRTSNEKIKSATNTMANIKPS